MQSVMRRTIQACALCALLSILPSLASAQAADPAAGTPAPAAAQEKPKASPATDAALLDWVLAHGGPATGDRRAGDVRVAYALTAAEGWWENAAEAKLAWHAAPSGQVHLRIFVIGSGQRLLLNLAVHARLTDEFGNTRSVPADFGWYPLLNAYGGNVELEHGHSYTLHVAVEADTANGNPTPVTADFPPIAVTPEILAALPLATALSFPEEAELLRPSNARLTSAITALWKETDSGSEEAVGDYFIGYAIGEATVVNARRESDAHRSGLRAFGMGGSPALAVFPRDARTGRVVPGLAVQTELLNAEGKSFASGPAWMAHTYWFDLYRRAADVPRKSVYKLRVRFAPPGFRRWGRQSERFAAPVDVELHNVILK